MSNIKRFTLNVEDGDFVELNDQSEPLYLVHVSKKSISLTEITPQQFNDLLDVPKHLRYHLI
jgi:hypothetical protein